MSTHFSCFTGIGGIDLAAEWAGFETVGQVEFADYPYQVLCKHWPDVPKWRDIRNVTGDIIRKQSNGKSPSLLSGGFPCQPFSYAGNRKGKEDNRFLWPEMFRLVQELRPSWFVGENVPGIITLALDQTITDLESIGYSVRTFDIPACAVGAFHIRRRIFIVANSNDRPLHKKSKVCSGRNTSKFSIEKLADTNRSGCVHGQTQEHSAEAGINAQCQFISSRPDVSISHGFNDDNRRHGTGQVSQFEASGLSGREYWSSEPGVGRVVDGLPDRVDRIKCLGNAVVPQQVYPILKAIATIELT